MFSFKKLQSSQKYDIVSFLVWLIINSQSNISVISSYYGNIIGTKFHWIAKGDHNEFKFNTKDTQCHTEWSQNKNKSIPNAKIIII